MQTSKVQCRGCKKWFQPRGLSQHLSKTQDRRCRDALAACFTVSRAPHVSASIQNAAMQPPNPKHASGGSPEHDHALRGQLSDAEIAVTREDISDDLDSSDTADADAYEELMRYKDSTTINPDQTTVGKAPELTEHEDQTGVGNHADLAPPQGTSRIVIDQSPIGRPSMPIPDRPQGSSVYESRRVASMDSPWAPFCSELDWKIARWSKMHGLTSTDVNEFLAIPGLVDRLGLSFRTVKELNKKLDLAARLSMQDSNHG